MGSKPVAASIFDARRKKNIEAAARGKAKNSVPQWADKYREVVRRSVCPNPCCLLKKQLVACI